MLNLLPASRLTTFGISHLGGRNYDYTEIYSANKQGEEAKENPRVWNVCLDEAENHDVDMIQGFLNIIDSLLVFAALFSEVVTTFVAQTSQVLRPDNAQIMVSLLIETNQLLRAVGNKTTISAVPAASLGLQSQTYTSVDVWVNGLFFTSLVLSLSTALLSVLAKQWIQAYTAIVPGSAKAHTLVRHFRFKGLVKWKLNDIIESLPLILHCSVAIFLVWLTLYVSQLSHPICGVVAGITACTFIFYLGSSMIPAIDGACPYRIPFMFSIAQLLLFAVYTTLDKCWNLWHILIQKSILGPQQTQWDILAWRSTWSLKKTEHNEASRKLLYTMDLAFDSLDWVTNQSSNPSGKEVIVEGTCGLLDDLSTSNAYIQPPIFSLEDSLFVFAITYSLSRLPDIYSTSSMVDKIGESTMYGRLIVTFMKIFHSQSLLLDEYHSIIPEAWKFWMINALADAYEKALRNKHHTLSQCLLDWGGPNLLQSATGQNQKFLTNCAKFGDAGDLQDLMNRGIDLNHHGSNGWTALHDAAFAGNIDVVIALVEQEPALLSAQAGWLGISPCTVLDFAIYSGKFDVVAYLLDHGAKSSSHSSLYHMMSFSSSSQLVNEVQFLLDHGWDRTVKDTEEKTLLNIACIKGNDALVEHLEHYQTVKLSLYKTIQSRSSCTISPSWL